MHMLFINHNGRDDKNRINTLRLLNLINTNLSVLKQLDVKMKIFAMTNTQITDNYNTIKTYNIKSFPTLIISADNKSNIIEGYNDIYNVYNNEINRTSGNAVIDIDENEMDGMDYIMSQMGNPDDQDDEEGSSNGSEAMSQSDIKKGMAKFDGKSKLVTTKYDSSSNKVDKTEHISQIAPSSSGDEMEDMMLQKMMDNI